MQSCIFCTAVVVAVTTVLFLLLSTSRLKIARGGTVGASVTPLRSLNV